MRKMRIADEKVDGRSEVYLEDGYDTVLLARRGGRKAAMTAALKNLERLASKIRKDLGLPTFKVDR